MTAPDAALSTPMPTSPEELLALLAGMGIQTETYEHEPIRTVAEGLHHKDFIPGTHCRNLFLRDKKKRMYLVTAANETAIDLKKLETLLGCARLSFGSEERLWQYLGVRPGSVCPFAVINDREHRVRVILDKAMMDSDLVNYHPLINDRSTCLTPSGLMRFFAHTGHDPEILDLSVVAPDML